MDDQESANFSAYRLMLLSRLDGLRCEIEALDQKLDRLRTDELQRIWQEINRLEAKAGVWGALAGLIPVLLAIGLFLINRKIGTP